MGRVGAVRSVATVAPEEAQVAGSVAAKAAVVSRAANRVGGGWEAVTRAAAVRAAAVRAVAMEAWVATVVRRLA